GAGATPLAAAVFLHGPHGLALSQASVPPPAQGADLADVVGWFDVGAALPDAPPGSIVTPGQGRAPAALSWAAAIVAARAHGHLLRDMGRTASGAYRVVRCTRCGGAIMARSAEEAGGRIVSVDFRGQGGSGVARMSGWPSAQ